MPSPRYTVIVPVPRFRLEEPILASLRENPPSSGAMQVIVAQGKHPARQRNAALEQAEGEIIVFLDGDCSLTFDFWKELEMALARPGVEIVGGPALLRPQATSTEKIFYALLTHTLIVGTVSARYSPRGEFCVASQTDLILCNLATKKSVFTRIGPLSTRLYPNEENEWLDRAQAAGIDAWYDPQLQVFRPQRDTWAQMGLMLLRYGIGRTRQFRVSGWRPTFHQILPPMVVFTFFALFHWHLEKMFITLWLLASAIIAVSCNSQLRWWQRIVAGLAAPLIPLTYTIGQIIGWLVLFVPTDNTIVEVVLFTEKGDRLPSSVA